LKYLIDTNVLSELRKKEPEPRVVSWIPARPRHALCLSVLTLGEIRKGVERVEDPARRQTLIEWLEFELPGFFAGRLLAVDAPVADRWGRLVAAAGRPLPAIDGLLAATALTHDLTLVTRNIKDFADLGVNLINPWDA
jgi:toxin FitB